MLRFMPVIGVLFMLGMILWIIGMGRGWWRINPFRPGRRHRDEEEE